MKTRLPWILSIALCLAAIGAVINCSSSGGGGSSAADDDASPGSGSVDSACQAVFAKCAPAGYSSYQEYCSAFDLAAVGGSCFVTAILNFFNCLTENDCVDPTCETTYTSATEACL